MSKTILAVLLWMTLISLAAYTLVMAVFVLGSLIGFLLWPYVLFADFLGYLYDRWTFRKEKRAARRAATSNADGLADDTPRNPLSRGLP